MSYDHDSLRRYLEQVSGFFKPPMCPLERFILDYGKDYAGSKRPKGLYKMRDKQCYKNAATISMSSHGLAGSSLLYVEGFAIHNGLIPVFHAWCVTDDGSVVDPTWRYPEKSVYRGVVIPHEILVRQLVKNKVYGALDTGFGIDVDLIAELKDIIDGKMEKVA